MLKDQQRSSKLHPDIKTIPEPATFGFKFPTSLMDSKVYKEKCGMKRKGETAPPHHHHHHTLASWDRIKTCLPWNPLSADDRRAHSTPGRNRGGGRGGEASEDGKDEDRASTLMAGAMIFFTRRHKRLPPPHSSSYLLVALALQARHTPPIPLSHTRHG